MPSNSLRSTLDSLATSFAGAVLDAIRGASIQELLAESGGAPRRGPGRPPKAPAAAKPARRAKPGRLPRRSPEEITKTLDRIHGLLKSKKGGMRSEEIRKALKLDVREVPRVLKEGLAKKKLKSRGQKRATTYTAG
jgi:hypothetical protein